MNDSEIGRLLNCNNSTVSIYRNKLGLEKNFKYKYKFDTAKFKQLYDQGLNDAEIARVLNSSDSAINSYRLSQKLIMNYLKYAETELTYDEEQVLIGTMIGDGHLRLPDDCKTVSGEFVHSTKQKDYCHWKYDKLKRFCKEPFDTYQDDKRTGKRYYKTMCRIYANPVFNVYYNNLYNDRVKYLSAYIVNKLDPLAIAIWYMDDGTYNHGSYTLCTNSFETENLALLVDMFKNKYNIQFRIDSKNQIVIKGKENAIKFKDLIEEYVLDDFKYKLRGPLKTPLNGEHPEVDNTVPILTGMLESV